MKKNNPEFFFLMLTKEFKEGLWVKGNIFNMISHEQTENENLPLWCPVREGSLDILDVFLFKPLQIYRKG